MIGALFVEDTSAAQFKVDFRFGSLADARARIKDVRFTPKEQTCPAPASMSAKCQEQTWTGKESLQTELLTNRMAQHGIEHYNTASSGQEN